MAIADLETVPLDQLITVYLQKLDTALQHYDKDLEQSDSDSRLVLSFVRE